MCFSYSLVLLTTKNCAQEEAEFVLCDAHTETGLGFFLFCFFFIPIFSRHSITLFMLKFALSTVSLSADFTFKRNKNVNDARLH